MTATVFTEAVHPFAFLVTESPCYESRDAVTIAQNQTIVVGQVLGAVGVVANETATPAAFASNTGNGVCTIASIGTAAIDGVYTIEFETAGAGATFELIDPNGAVVGKGVAGSAFTSAPLNFTVSNGGTNWAIGDLINITVARPVTNQQFEAWNPAATDGSQIAVAIAGYPTVTGAGVTTKITAITRRAEVRLTDLTFNGSATNAQIAEAVVQLNKQGITCR